MVQTIFRSKIRHLLSSLLLLLYISNINTSKQENEQDDFIDIGVRLVGDHRDELIADLIAEERDIFNDGHIDGVGLFHFYVRRKRNQRSKRSIDETIEDLKHDERIEFVTVGETLKREKREFLSDDEIRDFYQQYEKRKGPQRVVESDEVDTSSLKMQFDDALYRKQWYLENEGQLNTPANHDMNVVPAWLAGYTGRNITICIIDDGLDHPHPEIRDRYQPQFSYDLNDPNDTKHDPLPRTNNSENSHGTHCAGAAAGQANNGMCGVGVAYGSFISAIRVLDGRVTTLLEARALTLFAVDTHIKSASWGPTDDGTKMEAPGPIVNAAINYSVTYGRHGKGTIFVWASGNGGAAEDDCGADGYVSHHQVISIGSVNHLGQTTYFSEACPSTMAVAYTGGKNKHFTSETSLSIGVVAPDVGGKCTTSFFGTSGAAPVAAGAFALVLEANSALNYRDIMHIVARTARIPTLTETDDWIINGAGYHVSDKFGFGVLDVGQMTALAQNWTNVQQRYECYHEYTGRSRKLDIGTVVELSIDVKECENVTSIEHVVANISFRFHRRGDVKITLISPSGTPSEMLSYRKNDASSHGIDYFPFMSVHHWDESAEGRWTLRIETRQPQNSESIQSAYQYVGRSELSYFGLRIYGSHGINDRNSTTRKKRNENYAFVPTQKELATIFKREFALRESPNVMQKRDYQNLVQEREIQRRYKTATEQKKSLFESFQRVFQF